LQHGSREHAAIESGEERNDGATPAATIHGAG
jgi:hypothetical protein